MLNKVANSLNAKKTTVVLFCDLRKAFDTCNHQILFSKLKKYGINGLEQEWFKSYLSNRSQFVQIGSTKSSSKKINIGVPQGSILGPILFLLYINDIQEFTSLLAILFADDTALVASSDNLVSLALNINEELQKICQYFRKNGLSLHPDKTKFIIFTPNIKETSLKLFINNNNHLEAQDPTLITELQQVKTTDKIPAIKYLGVYFDPLLNFKYHVSKIAAKISCALFSLRQTKISFLKKP
jgi:hypothetical protein